MDKLYRRGRGSNPNSRANLMRGQAVRQFYVYVLEGGTWKRTDGPMFFRAAYQKSQALNEIHGPNHSAVST